MSVAARSVRRSAEPDRTRPSLVLAIGLAVLSTGCAVGLLATSAWLITRAGEHPPVLYLLVAVVGVRALGIFRGVFRYLERLSGHRVALHRQAELRLQTWQTLLAHSWVGRRSGDLLSRVISDVGAAQDRVVRVLLPGLAAAVVLIFACALLGLVSAPAAAWVTACTLVGAVGLPRLGSGFVARQETTVTRLRGELAAATAEAADLATDLLVYQAIDRSRARIAEIGRGLRAAEQRVAAVHAAIATGQLLSTGAAVLGALLIGAGALTRGELTGPLLAVLVLTPLALHEVLGTVPEVIRTGHRTRAALSRVEALPGSGAVVSMPSAAAIAAGPGHPRPSGVLIDARLLAIGYPDRLVADGLELRVRRGEVVGITGVSGAGKSTLAATLLGLLPARGGHLAVRGSVGYLAQDAHVFDTTVAENVRIGRADATDEDVATALRRAALDLDPDRLVGEHGSRVSGGEARRLALARLLVRSDDIVIMDEPTEHLDRPTADALRTTLLTATRDRAVIMISHDPALVATCDRVLELGPRWAPRAAGTSISCGSTSRADTPPDRDVAGSPRPR